MIFFKGDHPLPFKPEKNFVRYHTKILFILKLSFMPVPVWLKARGHMESLPAKLGAWFFLSLAKDLDTVLTDSHKSIFKHSSWNVLTE